MSLTKQMNKNGDRVSPCFTPMKLSNYAELTLVEVFVLTHDLTLLYIACNILTILHEQPMFNILNHIPFRYTRSNAFWKAKKAQ